jgi:hypothetical protein
MRNNFVVLQCRQIFGCEHQEKKITLKVIFERGLEIPASLCEFCVSNKSKI